MSAMIGITVACFSGQIKLWIFNFKIACRKVSEFVVLVFTDKEESPKYNQHQWRRKSLCQNNFIYYLEQASFCFRQRLKQNVKRNMQEQYAESEQELYRRTEQFLLKHGKDYIYRSYNRRAVVSGCSCLAYFQAGLYFDKAQSLWTGDKGSPVSLQKGNKKNRYNIS